MCIDVETPKNVDGLDPAICLGPEEDETAEQVCCGAIPCLIC